MSDSATNKEPVDTLIHYNEDYRRAKRNSLFWSFLTIVTTFSYDSETSSGILQSGLRLEAGYVTAFSFIITFFMFLGYIRAERILVIRNSESLRGQDAKEIWSALLTIKIRIEEMESSIRDRTDAFYHLLINLSLSVKQFFERRDKNFDLNLRNLSDISALVYTTAQTLGQNYAVNTSTTMESHIISDISRKLEEVENAIRIEWDNKLHQLGSFHEKRFDDISYEMDADILSALDNINSCLSDVAKDLDMIYKSFGMISGSIERSQRYWFRLYDRGMTYACFFASFVLVVISLVFGRPIVANAILHLPQVPGATG